MDYLNTTRTVNKTVKEVFEALAKNGFEHLRGRWFSYFDNKVIGGCVLGQAAINLSVDSASISELLNRFEVSPDSKWFVGGERLGDTIIHWNDRVRRAESGNEEYALKTYAEVVKMAKEVMRPYFNEILILEVAHYQFGKAPE